MKLNKKGFTLTELLVVVAILGIITGISIPLIRNLSKTFEKKKYQNYADSVLAAAKIYNDSYSEDLFGHNENGCAYITYQELVERDLLKDITIDKVSCNSNSTFVRVIKQRDKYSYAGFLGCGKKNSQGKASSIDTSLPKANTTYVMDTTYCTGVNENNLLITVDDTWIGNIFNKKRKTTSLTIKSGTGINNNIEIYTAWKSLETGTTTAWEKASFKVKGNQEKELLNGNIITTTSNQLITPKNGNGKYSLLVRVDNLQDLYGSKWKNVDNPTSNEFSKEPFSVDNTPPVITNLTVNSTKNDYNTLKTNVEFDANDKYTTQDNLKACITDKSNKCSSNSEYVKYKMVNAFTFTGNYDGQPRTIYVHVKDLAGNTSETTKEYSIPYKHVITYDSNGGNNCSPKTKTVYHADTNQKWGTLCSPTRVGYSFKEWNTKQDGSGTKITADSKISGDITVYAQWKANLVIIKMGANGATQEGKDTKYTVENDIVKRSGSDRIQTINYGSTLGDNGLLDYDNASTLYLYKANYTATAWNTKADGTGKDYNKTTKYAASDFCDAKNGDCTVTLYPKWRKNKIIFRFRALSDETLTKTVTSSDGSTTYTWTKDSSNNIYRKEGSGDSSIYQIPYEFDTAKIDLANYNNKHYLNIVKKGNHGVSGAEWICASGCTTSGKKFSQDKISMPSGVCDYSHGDCTVYLKVNWELNVCTITFNPNGGSFGTDYSTVQTMNYGKTVDNFWNANGGSFAATRSGYYILPAKAWVNGSTYYDETAGYSAKDICPNIETGNQSVTLKVNWSPNLKCPTVTAKKADGNSYTNKTWINQNINFTFNFSGTNATKYEWFTDDGSGGWNNWGTKDVSKTSDYISGSGKRSIKFKLHDANDKTLECASWNELYWIDKVAPSKPGISATSDGSSYDGSSFTDDDIDVTLTSSDSHSGIDYYQYTYNDNYADGISTCTDHYDCWKTYTTSDGAAYNSDRTRCETDPFVAERDQNAYFRACDKVGNCSSVSSLRIKIKRNSGGSGGSGGGGGGSSCTPKCSEPKKAEGGNWGSACPDGRYYIESDWDKHACNTDVSRGCRAWGSYESGAWTKSNSACGGQDPCELYEGDNKRYKYSGKGSCGSGGCNYSKRAKCIKGSPPEGGGLNDVYYCCQ